MVVPFICIWPQWLCARFGPPHKKCHILVGETWCFCFGRK